MKLTVYSVFILLVFVSCAGKFSIKKRRYSGGLYFAYSRPVKVNERNTLKKELASESKEPGGKDKSIAVEENTRRIKKEVSHKEKPAAKTPVRNTSPSLRKKLSRPKTYFGYNEQPLQLLAVSYTDQQTVTEYKRAAAAKPGRFKRFLLLVLTCVVGAAVVFCIAYGLSAGTAAAIYLLIAGVLLLADLLLIARLFDS